MRYLVAVVLLSAAACTSDPYYWDAIPHCHPEGSHFTNTMYLITKLSDGGGFHLLHGMRPSLGNVFDDSVLVAVVACESRGTLPSANDLDAVLRGFDETTVPVLCVGQRTIAGPMIVRATATSRPGYGGALPFPTIPPSELGCEGAGHAVRLRPEL